MTGATELKAVYCQLPLWIHTTWHDMWGHVKDLVYSVHCLFVLTLYCSFTTYSNFQAVQSLGHSQWKPGLRRLMEIKFIQSLTYNIQVCTTNVTSVIPSEDGIRTLLKKKDLQLQTLTSTITYFDRTHMQHFFIKQFRLRQLQVIA